MARENLKMGLGFAENSDKVLRHGCETAKRGVALLTGVCLSIYASCMLAGTVGRTWPVAESDILYEIERRAAKIEIDSEKMEERIDRHVPSDSVNLPRATESREFSPDMSYTLPFDVVGANGTVIYPMGFRFDPMEYVSMPTTIVIFNPEDPEQLEWYRKNYAGNVSIQAIATAGSYRKHSKQLGRSLYYLPEIVARRFRLKAVPVIIRNVGNRIVVNEIDPSAKD